MKSFFFNKMNQVLIIFDLDDTLVNFKMRVPRQTYHMLNRFARCGIIMGIISYNAMLHFVCSKTKLYRYTKHVFYGEDDRETLFKRCLTQILSDYNIEQEECLIYYVDDRLDHLENVGKSLPNVKTIHCNDMYNLYRIKHVINK